MALVKSCNGDISIELGDPHGADMTARLLLALTALYAHRPTHTAEEQQQYVELALRLIDKVGVATRTAVAGILGRHAQAPVEVVERLGARQSRRDGEPEGESHPTQDQPSVRNQSAEGNPRLGNDECVCAPFDTAAAWQLPTPYSPPDAGEDREGAFGEACFAASPSERRNPLSLIGHGCSDDVQAAADSERLYASLRSRFLALTERVQRQAVNAPPDRGSVARRGLRSR